MCENKGDVIVIAKAAAERGSPMKMCFYEKCLKVSCKKVILFSGQFTKRGVRG